MQCHCNISFKQTPSALRRLAVHRVGKSLQGLLLFAVQLFRHLNHQGDDMVAAHIAVAQRRNPLALQARAAFVKGMETVEYRFIS